MLNPIPSRTSLQEDLRAAEAGDENALDRVCDAFQAVEGPGDKELVQVLKQAMELENRDLRLYAVLAAGKIGEPASELVPQLLNSIQGDDQTIIFAAGLALRDIPGEKSIEGMVEAFDRLERASEKAAVAECLCLHGPGVEPYLSRLDQVSGEYPDHERDLITRATGKVRDMVHSYHGRDFSGFSFQSRVPLCPYGVGGNLDEHYAAYSVQLPKAPGLIYADRFRYSAVDAPVLGIDKDDLPIRSDVGEVGVQVFRSFSGKDSHVVVLSVDKHWYGIPPAKVFDRLATAVVHVFGLDPLATTFVERWTRGTGLSFSLHDESSVVTMHYDSAKKSYFKPVWSRLSNLEDFLRQSNVM